LLCTYLIYDESLKILKDKNNGRVIKRHTFFNLLHHFLSRIVKFELHVFVQVQSDLVSWRLVVGVVVLHWCDHLLCFVMQYFDDAGFVLWRWCNDDVVVVVVVIDLLFVDVVGVVYVYYVVVVVVNVEWFLHNDGSSIKLK
jgi:hypothetical protein